jgi:tRNA pseudouridine38-40 synthase
MARNIKLVIEYDGTRYHGWQYQEGIPTVQATLEKAIFKLCGEPIRIHAAGRTDTGVHARGQVVSFHMERELPIHNIRMGINAHLPDDIVVRSGAFVDDAFHARYSARQRVYHYWVSLERTAILKLYCWQMMRPLNRQLLEEMATRIIGMHDFAAFCRTKVQSDHKRCIVSESSWQQQGALLIYRIAANRFLHGMVRTLVGTMIDVARGRFSLAEFETIFNSGDRTLGGPAAPSRGLYLEEVLYDETP